MCRNFAPWFQNVTCFELCMDRNALGGGARKVTSRSSEFTIEVIGVVLQVLFTNQVGVNIGAWIPRELSSHPFQLILYCLATSTQVPCTRSARSILDPKRPRQKAKKSAVAKPRRRTNDSLTSKGLRGHMQTM